MGKGNDTITSFFNLAKSISDVPVDFIMNLTDSKSGDDLKSKAWKAFMGLKSEDEKDKSKIKLMDSAKDLGKSTFGQPAQLKTYPFNTEPLRDFNTAISRLLTNSTNKDIQDLVNYRRYVIQANRQSGRRTLGIESSRIAPKSRGFLDA